MREYQLIYKIDNIEYYDKSYSIFQQERRLAIKLSQDLKNLAFEVLQLTHNYDI